MLRVLSSTKLAFVLITLVAICLLVSALVPQRGIAQERVIDWQHVLGDRYQAVSTLRLDRMYSSPVFLSLLVLLGINLALGNIRRFQTVLRTERTLLKTRYIGSILFHLSLLFILGSVIAHYLYRYDGLLALTEGQRVQDSSQVFAEEDQGPWRTKPYDRFAMRLDAVDTAFSVAGTESVAAKVTLWSSSGEEPIAAVLRTNHPYRLEELEIHYGLSHGYSPELVVLDGAGGRVFGGFVRLARQAGHDTTVHADYYVLEEHGLRVDISLSSAEKFGDPPLVGTMVTLGDTVLFNGEVGPVDTAQAGPFRITFPRLRRWCYINVVESPFLGNVFAGFWAALGGLVLTLVARLGRSTA